MRGWAWIGCIAMAAWLVAPAMAQASFQRTGDPGDATYWDAGSIKRSGDDFEIDVLQVYKFADHLPLSGSITRHKLSCVWSASVGGTLGSRSINEAGKVLNTFGPEPFSQGSFYGPHGWQAEIVPIVCNPAMTPPKGLGVAEAMADARMQLAKPTATRVAPRRGPVPPADTAAARFGVIRADKASGNMAFLDWSRIARADDKATVHVLEVLGDNTPPPPEPQWTYAVIALRTLELDCTAQTVTETGYSEFSKHFEPGFPDGATWPVRTAADWPLGAQILWAACSGAEPARTYATRAAAIAHQRSLHPLRK